MKIPLRTVLKDLNIQMLPVLGFLGQLGYDTSDYSINTKLDEVQYRQVFERFAKRPQYTQAVSISPLYFPRLGDVIHIPEHYLLQHKTLEYKGTKAPYVYALVTDRFGKEKSVTFLTNSLGKSITPIIDGLRQAKVRTTGTALELYRSVDSCEEAVALLGGKMIKVTKDDIYTVEDFKTKKLRKSHIYQYDLIETAENRNYPHLCQDMEHTNTNGVVCTYHYMQNDIYLQSPESYRITEGQKLLAAELVEIESNHQPEHDKECSDSRSDFVYGYSCSGFEIKRYGTDYDQVVVATKGSDSLVIFRDNQLYDRYNIVPLPGKVEEISIHYQELVIEYMEMIISNRQGKKGVYDHNGKCLLPFQPRAVSFVRSSESWMDAPRYLYLIEGDNYYSVYYKDRLMLDYGQKVSRVIAHFNDETQHIAVAHRSGWQIYDFKPWFDMKSDAPVPLLERKLPHEGWEPLPEFLGDGMIGVFKRRYESLLYGFVDMATGSLVIPIVYCGIISGFKNGRAQVSIDDRDNYVIIDSHNTIQGWGNSQDDDAERECRYGSNWGDWSFAKAELEDFRDNYDPN